MQEPAFLRRWVCATVAPSSILRPLVWELESIPRATMEPLTGRPRTKKSLCEAHATTAVSSYSSGTGHGTSSRACWTAGICNCPSSKCQAPRIASRFGSIFVRRLIGSTSFAGGLESMQSISYSKAAVWWTSPLTAYRTKRALRWPGHGSLPATLSALTDRKLSFASGFRRSSTSTQTLPPPYFASRSVSSCSTSQQARLRREKRLGNRRTSRSEPYRQ